MSWLEIAGFIGLWIAGTVIVCLIAVFFGERYGRDQGLGGIIFIIYPPIIVLIVSAVIGVFVLGRITA